VRDELFARNECCAFGVAGAKCNVTALTQCESPGFHKIEDYTRHPKSMFQAEFTAAKMNEKCG